MMSPWLTSTSRSFCVMLKLRIALAFVSRAFGAGTMTRSFSVITSEASIAGPTFSRLSHDATASMPLRVLAFLLAFGTSMSISLAASVGVIPTRASSGFSWLGTVSAILVSVLRLKPWRSRFLTFSFSFFSCTCRTAACRSDSNALVSAACISASSDSVSCSKSFSRLVRSLRSFSSMLVRSSFSSANLSPRPLLSSHWVHSADDGYQMTAESA